MQINVNLSEMEQSENREWVAMPEGWYPAEVIKEEWKQVNLKPGQSEGDPDRGAYLSLTFRVTAGTHEGRLFWGNFNLKNIKEDTVKRAKADLGRLAVASGLTGLLTDTTHIHNRPVEVFLNCKPGYDGKDRNEPKKYRKLKTGVGGAPIASDDVPF